MTSDNKKAGEPDDYREDGVSMNLEKAERFTKLMAPSPSPVQEEAPERVTVWSWVRQDAENVAVRQMGLCWIVVRWEEAAENLCKKLNSYEDELANLRAQKPLDIEGLCSRIDKLCYDKSFTTIHDCKEAIKNILTTALTNKPSGEGE